MFRAPARITVGFALFISGCAASQVRTAAITGQPEMRAAILDNVPLGSSIAQAEEFMKSEGFTCKVQRNTSWAERSADGRHVSQEGIDYLYCTRADRAGFLVAREWKVALVLEGDAVKDAFVNAGLTGP